jgi:hypothetical protein
MRTEPGLEDAKQDLREMVELPMTRPDLFSAGGAAAGGTDHEKSTADSAATSATTNAASATAMARGDVGHGYFCSSSSEDDGSEADQRVHADTDAAGVDSDGGDGGAGRNGAGPKRKKGGGTVRGRSGILLYGPPGTGKTLLVRTCLSG